MGASLPITPAVKTEITNKIELFMTAVQSKHKNKMKKKKTSFISQSSTLYSHSRE